MRATWVVLGALLVGGGAAYWHLRWNSAGAGGADAPAAGTSKALEHNVPTVASPAERPTEPSAPNDPDEVLAVRLLQAIAEAKAAGDAAKELPRKARQTTQGAPLVVGLLAAGVGFLVASLIPTTQAETRLSASLRDRAQPLVDQTFGAMAAAQIQACY